MYDFRIEWCSVMEEKPITKTPVLVLSKRFKYGYAVCRYDGVWNWILDGLAEPFCNFKTLDDDLWAYLADIDEV